MTTYRNVSYDIIKELKILNSKASLWQAGLQMQGGDCMVITRQTVTTITEKVSIRIDESKATVFLNDEKETEAVETVIKAAERALNLNSKKQG